MGNRLLSTILSIAVAATSICGCDESKEGSDDKASKAEDDSGADDDDDEETDEPAKSDYGPTVTIEAGQLHAGSRCYDIPRIRPDELVHEHVSMGEFEMDLYPYPNESGKAAKLDVSWNDAKELCEKRGKRLCSEMEWERACKGDANKTYMWGDGFKPKEIPCSGQTDHVTGQRDACKSPTGVMDMVGLAMEWTSSSWERGTPSGDRVVRGAPAEKVSWVAARCTHSRKRDPNKSFDNVGFRCCSGDDNPAKVVLERRKRTTITEEFDIDDQFQRMLLKGMPPDHRKIRDVAIRFDKVWRWHPVANEEMIIGRWRGTPKDGDPFFEVAVFKLCGSRAWPVTRLRGPVESISKPKTAVSATKITFDVKTKRRSGAVTMSYWQGNVKTKQPDFIKKGNQLKVKPGKRFRIPKLKKKK